MAVRVAVGIEGRRVIVDGHTHSSLDRFIVQAIINMSHSLGLEVVAEGVEDQLTKDRLAALGCDSAQGYHICHPLPAGEMTSWLKESSSGLNSAIG